MKKTQRSTMKNIIKCPSQHAINWSLVCILYLVHDRSFRFDYTINRLDLATRLCTQISTIFFTIVYEINIPTIFFQDRVPNINTRSCRFFYI